LQDINILTSHILLNLDECLSVRERANLAITQRDADIVGYFMG